jgi:hypothetical protein
VRNRRGPGQDGMESDENRPATRLPNVRFPRTAHRDHEALRRNHLVHALQRVRMEALGAGDRSAEAVGERTPDGTSCRRKKPRPKEGRPRGLPWTEFGCSSQMTTRTCVRT